MFEQTENVGDKKSRLKLIIVLICTILIAVFSLTYFDDSIKSRATLVAGFCLILWLSEIVPPYVPTFILWALTVLLLNPVSDKFNLTEVLKWSANPVLLLFFGGFSFGVAASRYGLDNLLAKVSVKLSGGNRIFLLVLTVSATAFMSMWMSNIAATAMMIAALHPLISKLELQNNFRKALLLGIAVGANFGGIATPIGTGPNAIAISALAKYRQISFVDWMSFALPITVGLLIAGTVLIVFLYRVKGDFKVEETEVRGLSTEGKFVVAIFILTIFAWLTEPFHGVSSSVTALISAAVLFGSNLLRRKDLNSIDWGTIALIAGGISLGNLLEQAGLISFWADKISWAGMPFTLQVFVVCFVSALLAALMSNTATVTMLVPFALSFIPNPSIAVLVAVSASFGIPFIISTPINAMVHGEGGLNAKDFFIVGFPLMILGCLILALTGFYFLSFWF
jgi:solute carrier family 13 (sodium-dependent dicarboxylate transporter), member 2/3/5